MMKSSYINIALLSFIMLSCQSGDAKTNENKTSQNLNSVRYITEVNTVVAKKRDFEYIVNVQGRIDPSKEVQVIFRTTGIVEELNWANGERIGQDRIILQIENKEQTLALQKANAELERQLSEYKTKLLEFGIDPVKDTSTQKMNYLRVMSGLATAEIKVKQGQLALDYTTIKAPISGIIADLNVKEGNIVYKGDYCCTIYSEDHLVLNTKILETDFKKVAIGQRAEVRPIAQEDLVYQAQVMGINPKVDESGMIGVQLELLETRGLLAGMNAKAIIKVPYHKNIIVPKSAVIIRSGKEVVFTAEDDRAKWNYVTTGMDNGKEIEILEGLRENSNVIISNNLQLAHDTPIKVIE